MYLLLINNEQKSQFFFAFTNRSAFSPRCMVDASCVQERSMFLSYRTCEPEVVPKDITDDGQLGRRKCLHRLKI